MKLKRIIFLLFVFCSFLELAAQKKETAKDSTQMYQKIETYSKKSKFTKMIHRWIFRPTSHKPEREPEHEEKPSYSKFEGKIIRKIIINTKDPFGYSFTDSTETANSFLEKTGNAIHIKSKEMAIQNFLLLKKNQPLDTLLITESARLLRAQNYIREVRILPRAISESKDSVDVIVTSLDSWSLIPKAQFTSSQTKLKLKERNFIGTGHEFRIGFSKRMDDGSDAFNGSYTVPNFKNTFVSATGRYSIDYDGYYEKTISLDRIFYSPLTRWAGGIFLQERYLGRELHNDTLAYINQDFKFITQDYWGGHSFRIFNGDSERERTTNLIVSARALLVDYKNMPAIAFDSIRYFSDERLYLASIGVASRQFVEDSYIFRDGRTEDVPVGIIYSITGGIQHKNQLNRFYLGGKASYGNYFKWGFVSTNFELGTFFNGSKTEQTAFSFQASYFSHLLPLGDKWKMRQFVKPQFIIGINRLDSEADRLTLNERADFNGVYGNLYSDYRNGAIDGFDGELSGTQKYVLALQTQFYSPWELFGFRFNPFLNITVGMLAESNRSWKRNPIYSSFGIGCIIRNDYLVFNSFQFSLAYYPNIPGQGNNIIKTNAFETDDFGFQDFQIGKPRTVNYN
ncbi:hypothetical protein [Aequorivita capsosiphonis]|uniref:hypothetical protein n=1 Tax=Aequorivita capsosiphonis TaxID=487317 RepID=UPI00042061D5|nr:hypothetical protein [Aequorivita capsosiphonis]